MSLSCYGSSTPTLPRFHDAFTGSAYPITCASKGPGKLPLGSDCDGSDCVLPSEQTIESGQYSPLSRPLYIYVTTKSLQRPEVRAFVEFYLEHGADLSAEVGYIALEPAEYENGLAAIK